MSRRSRPVSSTIRTSMSRNRTAGLDRGRPRPSSPWRRPTASRCGRRTACTPTARDWAGTTPTSRWPPRRSWTTTLPALPHYCVAYCSHRSATITRQVSGEPPERDVALLPRLFGMVPADRSSDWTLKGSPDIQLIYLRRSMVDRLAEEVLGVDGDHLELVPRLGFADGLMEQLALALQEAARRDDGAGDGLYADHVIRLMALHLVRNHAARPGPPWSVRTHHGAVRPGHGPSPTGPDAARARPHRVRRWTRTSRSNGWRPRPASGPTPSRPPS